MAKRKASSSTAQAVTSSSVAGVESVFQLKFTLRDIAPPIWRRVLVRDGTLGDLHCVIQVAMGWMGGHLHAFDVGGEQYGEPDIEMDTEDEEGIRLSEVLRGRKKFTYMYDFGDSWDHIIELEKKVTAESDMTYPRCIAGKRACPPEDCGGPWGYPDFLNILADPRHKEHESMVDWMGDEDFDPEKFELDDINRRLASLTGRPGSGRRRV
jgi:Plasmid pRiA4b ORF-3-like protein